MIHNIFLLKIPDRRPFVFLGFEIIFVFKKKCHHEINNDGGAESEKGKINKVHTDGSGFNAHFFAHPGTYSKEGSFDEFPKALDHKTKVKKVRLRSRSP